MAATESAAVQARITTSTSPGTDVIVTSGSVQQDAFDSDDFDAVAYINEMFPTGQVPILAVLIRLLSAFTQPFVSSCILKNGLGEQMVVYESLTGCCIPHREQPCQLGSADWQLEAEGASLCPLLCSPRCILQPWSPTTNSRLCGSPDAACCCLLADQESGPRDTYSCSPTKQLWKQSKVLSSLSRSCQS